LFALRTFSAKDHSLICHYNVNPHAEVAMTTINSIATMLLYASCDFWFITSPLLEADTRKFLLVFPFQFLEHLCY
jgi:hypothetical protein